MTRVFVGLGSNLGDRRGHLEWAVEQLQRILTDLRVSTIIETSPVGVPDEQPDYLNAVVTGGTTLTARELLDELLRLEGMRGRDSRGYRSARTLDLDLIFYGQEQIDASGLVVPHPRFRDRHFVLGPLAELAPDWTDPATGKSLSTLAAELAPKEKGA